MSAFPPLKSKPSVPIPQDAALKRLQSYLEKAKDAEYLLPNARLEETGVDAGSRNSSLVFHNLQRVEAGLRGEWLAPSLDLEGVKVAGGEEATQNTAEAEAEGWQDLEEYQREQSIEEGEQEARGVVAVNLDSGLQDDDETQEPDATVSTAKTPKDKEARKLEKKARHKERQRQKETMKQQSKE
ncbi:hypothetical protein F5884DRAFT_419754 [Xylogone sp. PMI_703]|nr:hypothetical protein F5884DRAFT_419754 [Xylogone sp. PMI_703]